MKESDVQKAILDYLRYRGIFCFKNNTVGIYKRDTGAYIPSQSKGSPDIICVVDGKFIGIEVKGPSGRQSPDQIEFQERLERAGGRYIVARSIDDVEHALFTV